MDEFVGMTPEDEARARAYRAEQTRIQKARERAARALLAPPGPAQAVRAAWAPLKAALDEKRAGGGTRGTDRR